MQLTSSPSSTVARNNQIRRHLLPPPIIDSFLTLQIDYGVSVTSFQVSFLKVPGHSIPVQTVQQVGKAASIDRSVHC